MAPRQSAVYRRKNTNATTSAMEMSVEIKLAIGIEIPPSKLIELFEKKYVILSILAHGAGTDCPAMRGPERSQPAGALHDL